MDPDNIVFEEFFATRLKQKGMTLKKLGEVTGISPSHLQELARGDFGALPSAPYAHGYLVRIGKMLDFDGEEWWNRIKNEGLIRNSGPADSLPYNRFTRESPARMIIFSVIALLIVAYLIIQFPRLWGKPTVVILSPTGNPATSDTSTITIQGTAQNADSLYLNGDEVTLAPDGSWQKDVLLAPGTNSFAIAAKKFLRSETDIVEQVIYEPPISATVTPSIISTTTAPLTNPTATASTSVTTP